MSTLAAAPIRIRTRRDGELVEVSLQMPHPMETGLRADPAGRSVPAHHITDVVAEVDGRIVFQARMSYAVSRDPVVRFRFRGATTGQRLQVAWTDNRGNTRVDGAPIA